MKKLITMLLVFALVFSCVQIPAYAAWQQQDGNWYYQDANGQPVTGWFLDGNTWYYFDSQGVMQTGWLNLGGTWYYMNASGAMVTGWLQLGSTWYYMNASGAMVTGWLDLGGTWYYMDETGAMVTGIYTIGGVDHEFNASGAWLGEVQKVQKNGWELEDGKWYYYKEDVKATGWLDLSGTWYYLDETGAMVTGIYTIGGVEHEFNASGVWLGEVQQPKKNGWELDGGVWYYYKDDVKATGWLDLNGTWYYMDETGAMVTGIYTIGGVEHEFNASGAWLGEVQKVQKNGWELADGKWYYYKDDVKATGWLDLSGTWYYLDETGAMVTGIYTIGGVEHEFNASGVWLGEVQQPEPEPEPQKNGWISEGGKWYYYKDDVKTTGWLDLSGTWYYLDETGAMVTGWLQLGSVWYYLDASGAMVTGIVTIDGVKHEFNASGVWLGQVQTPQPDPNDREDPPAAPATATVTIGIPQKAMVSDYDNNALTQWLETQTGYQVDVVYYSSSSTDMRSQISTQISRGEKLPDILIGCNLGADEISALGEDGYLEDLTPYFLDTDGAAKNFWDRLTGNLTYGELDQVMRTIYDVETDAIYAVPTITTDAFNTNCMAWINEQWLDKLNLEMPTNMEEFYNVLVAFRDQDPNGNGIKDEIPLLGAENVNGAHVTEWLINMFVYYNPVRLWQPDENGVLQPVFTQDVFREAMKFINRLYKENLLHPLSFTIRSSEYRTFVNVEKPTIGVMVCDMSTFVEAGISSEILEQYAPINNWGYTVESNISCKTETFITTYCSNVPAAFKVLMTLFSEEGTLRMRYGEKGVNWTDEDVWGQSSDGSRANIEILQNVNAEPNASWWGFQACGLLDYEGSAAVKGNFETDQDYWLADKMEHAQKYILWGVYSKTPGMVCPMLKSSELAELKTPIMEYMAQTAVTFILGSKDVNNDADWAAYLQGLEDLELDGVTATMQQLYDTQADCVGAEHQLANATCTLPQTCIYCQGILGDAKGHDYGATECSRCHMPTPTLTNYTWGTIAGTENQIAVPEITFYEDGTCYISISYYNPVNLDEDENIVYFDWGFIGDALYAQSPSGTWRDGTYTVSGDTVIIDIYGSSIVLTKYDTGVYLITSADGYVQAGMPVVPAELIQG